MIIHFAYSIISKCFQFPQTFGQNGVNYFLDSSCLLGHEASQYIYVLFRFFRCFLGFLQLKFRLRENIVPDFSNLFQTNSEVFSADFFKVQKLVSSMFSCGTNCAYSCFALFTAKHHFLNRWMLYTRFPIVNTCHMTNSWFRGVNTWELYLVQLDIMSDFSFILWWQINIQ